MGEASQVVIPLFGILDVTGEVIAMWIILALVALISFLVTRNLKERPGTFQNIVETGVEYLDNFFSDLIGKHHARKYFYFLGSMFVFIIFSNYFGLIPGVGLTDYVKAPTASLSVTAGLGLCSFIFLQMAGLSKGPKHFFKRFLSVAMPLLILDEFIKPASLALRLFGNVYGEESVIHQMYDAIPYLMPAIVMGLSCLFCAIQAVVFTMLTSIYLEEVLE